MENSNPGEHYNETHEEPEKHLSNSNILPEAREEHQQATEKNQYCCCEKKQPTSNPPRTFWSRPFWTEGKRGGLSLIFDLLLLVATATYTVFASKQWVSMNGQLDQMRQQTTLTRQQLVGTQGAVLQWDIHSPDGGTRGVVGGIRNAGVVTATGVRIRVQITRQTISADGNIKETGQPVTFDDTPDRIKGGSGVWPESYPHVWPVPWMSTTDPSNVRTAWPSSWPGSDATGVKAHVAYDNGFGDIGVSDVCVEFLPIFYIKTRDGTMTIGGAYACDSVRDGVPEARKRWERVKPQ